MTEAVRGLEQWHEHAAQTMSRDTRPLGDRVADVLVNPYASIFIYTIGIICVWAVPAISDLIFVSAAIMFAFAYTRKSSLPFKLPATSHARDYNDLKPGSFAPSLASGITFFGNHRFTQEELWFNNSDMRTHVLIFGSTGSGKTEALISLAFNALNQGSGFIYIDGKGDNSLFAKIYSMTRKMGRDDDLLAINFMTGARDVVGAQQNRLSNTVNPFSQGSSSMLSQLVVSLMDQSSGDANADMWKGRAINFVESLMKILAIMRDRGHILLDANTIRDYFLLDRLESIVIDKKFPLVESNIKVPIDDLPSQFLDPLKNYVLNLPGYNPAKKGRQGGEVLEQHGFITMQLTRVFGSLADTYGHILRTNLAEVDLKDVVLNRRILVVLLPALEKSPEELSNLGKIIIASLKVMMASGLGDALEGKYKDVILSKPTNSPTPYMCIMDEYGYYAVKGFAVVAAQARSLGFSAIFAGQDLPAFQKASKEEAASIGANCNIKICMKLEDPQETWEYFNKTAGETYVTNVSGFQLNPGSMSINYLDSRNTSVDRRQRIELLDLKDQREGEAHVFFKSKVIRAKMFYANPDPVEDLRLAHFLKVEKPTEEVMKEISERRNKIISVLREYDFTPPTFEESPDIELLQQSFDASYNLRPVERGLAGIISLLETEIHEAQTKPQINLDIDDSCFTLNEENTLQTDIFDVIPVLPVTERMIGEQNIGLFSQPILNEDKIKNEFSNIDRMTGTPYPEAKTNSENLIEDIKNQTTFIKDNPGFYPTKDEYISDINQVLIMLGGSPVDISPIPTPHQSEIDEIIKSLKKDQEKKNNSKNLDFDSLPDLPDLPDLPELPDITSFNDLPDFDHLNTLPDLPGINGNTKDTESNNNPLLNNDFKLPNISDHINIIEKDNQSSESEDDNESSPFDFDEFEKFMKDLDNQHNPNKKKSDDDDES